MRPGETTLLMKAPNVRQQAARRRLVIVCAMLGLALASGLAGSIIRPGDDAAIGAATGPFSYFPYE